MLQSSIEDDYLCQLVEQHLRVPQVAHVLIRVQGQERTHRKYRRAAARRRGARRQRRESLHFAHRYDEAITQLRTALAINPDYWFAREWLGRAYARLGRFTEAVAELRAAQQSEGSGNAEIESALGRAYADAGNTAEATKVLDHLRERMGHEFVSRAFLATVQVGLGKTDDALASLAQADAQHSWLVPLWKVDPELDPLRSDPRFTALLKKAGLDE